MQVEQQQQQPARNDGGDTSDIEQAMLNVKPLYRETLEYRHKDYTPLHPDIYTLNAEHHLHPNFLRVVQESKNLIHLLIRYQQLSKMVFLMEEEMENQMNEQKKQVVSQSKENENKSNELDQDEEEEEWEFTPEQQLIRDEFVQVQKEFNSKRRDILAQWLTMELPDVYSLDVFTMEFQQKLLQEVEHFSKSVEIHLRPNSMNNFGVVCDEMGLNTFFDSFICDYFTHAARLLNKGAWIIDDHHTFIVEYAPSGDVNLDMHVDDSELTLNICLGKPGFEGGNVFFAGRQDQPRAIRRYGEYQNQIGKAILHDGINMHGAKDLTKGERMNLIIWCRSSAKRKGTTSRINFHAESQPQHQSEHVHDSTSPTHTCCNCHHHNGEEKGG